MSMSDRERGELVKLWREIPKCIPFGVELRYVESAGWLATPHGGRAAMWPDYLVSALARDAIVEWLLERGYDVQRTGGEGVPVVFLTNDYLPEDHPLYTRCCALNIGWDGPTRLSALIAAARAVGGKG